MRGHSLNKICSGTTETELWIREKIHPAKIDRGFTEVPLHKYSIILDIIYRLVLYLKHTFPNVRTSRETHYVYATSPID
jgi:hypothetical protein